MASTNFKLFDENKTNMMSDTEYNINTQRLNGVQAGIASSQLQNKTLHQTSLVAYSLAQIMMQNGYDANDSAAVSAFVGNMSNSLLQKVLDKATSAEAQAGTVTNKWISPATMKAAALLLSGGTMSGILDMGGNRITNLGTPTADSDAITKEYANSKYGSKILVSSTPVVVNSSGATDAYNGSFDLNLEEDLDLNEADAIGFEIVFNSDFNVIINISGYNEPRDYSVSVDNIMIFSGTANRYGFGVLAVNGKRFFRTFEFSPISINTSTGDEAVLGEYFLDYGTLTTNYQVYTQLHTGTKIARGSKINVSLESGYRGTYTFNASFTVNIYKYIIDLNSHLRIYC